MEGKIISRTKISIPFSGFLFLILLMVIAKIIADPIICYNFICNLF